MKLLIENVELDNIVLTFTDILLMSNNYLCYIQKILNLINEKYNIDILELSIIINDLKSDILEDRIKAINLVNKYIKR